MGHGKESPRQKMIGMMYLVLTAMLAMNVSAEVLDAFRLVNEGIKETTENYGKKNKTIYKDFEEEVAKNELKAGSWKIKADSVRDAAEELYSYIQGLKVEMLKMNQGENIEDNKALYEENGKIKVDHNNISGEDKYDLTTRYLIGENKNGKAYTLKEKIGEYNELLTQMIREKDVKIRESVSTTLNTEDPPTAPGHDPKSWEVKHFYKIPIGAIYPILSKLQADVRNAESELIQYLFQRIDAGDFAFNKLEATVIPNSSLIYQGNEYKADVFLAARDTTAPPKVLIGEWDSVRRDDGTYDVVMRRVEDTLEVSEGKGKYTRKTTSTGVQKWGGIIMLLGPEGDTIKKPFRREYQVEQPNLVISPTKMNVFYVGIPNPVSISVPGIAADRLNPSISNGRLYKVSPGNYEVKPNDPGRESVISVRGEVDGRMQSFGSKRFRVKPLPTPVAQVGGKSGGDMGREILIAQSGVYAVMEDFLFELQYTITQYTITTTDRAGYVIDTKQDGFKIDPEVRKWLQDNAQRGRKITFEDLRAVGPDGSVKELNPITFTIQ